jgi:hypothetical protein
LLFAGIVQFSYASRSFATLTDVLHVVKVGIISAIIWASALLFIKLSVAIALLRLQQDRAWRLFLYFFAGVLVLNALTQTLFLVLQCRPLGAAWDPSITHAKCIDSETFSQMLNAGNFINVVTDVVLSLYPLTFLYKLRRPFLEKALIFVLMAVGLTASAAAIVKIVYVVMWANATMTFSVGFTISMWTCTEMMIGVVAACLPSLKSTLQRGLTWCGVKFRPREDFHQGGSFVVRGHEGDHQIRTLRTSSPKTSDRSSTQIFEGPYHQVPKRPLPRVTEGSLASTAGSASDVRIGSSWYKSETKLVKGKEAEVV